MKVYGYFNVRRNESNQMAFPINVSIHGYGFKL